MFLGCTTSRGTPQRPGGWTSGRWVIEQSCDSGTHPPVVSVERRDLGAGRLRIGDEAAPPVSFELALGLFDRGVGTMNDDVLGSWVVQTYDDDEPLAQPLIEPVAHLRRKGHGSSSWVLVGVRGHRGHRGAV